MKTHGVWALAAATIAVIIAQWLVLYNLHASGPVHQIDRNDVVHKEVVTLAGFASLGFIVASVLIRIRRKSVPILLQEILAELRAPRTAQTNGGTPPAAPNWSSLGRVLKIGLYDVLLLGKMGNCEDFQQWIAHFLTMWGFIGLFVTTTLDAIVNPAAIPLPLLHPVRVLGNVSGALFMTGLTIAIARRALVPNVRRVTTASDLAFLLVMYGTGLTGYLVQWYADHGDAAGTAISYIAHLIFIGLLIPTAPWTKFVHALWRPTWIVYSNLKYARSGAGGGG